MSAVHTIGRAHVNYRVPPEATDLPARLDALLEEVLERAFETALARLVIGHDEEVCVRSVTAQARVATAATDEELIAGWSAPLADAIAAAIAMGEPDAIRYASRRQALVDVALGASSGDLRRMWAWRQLGLWPERETPDGTTVAASLVDTLCGEPHAVVSALAAIARHGSLPRLAVLLTPAGWQRLATAALAAAGLDASLLYEPESEVEPSPTKSNLDLNVEHPPAGGVEARALTVLASSALARSAVASGVSAGLAHTSRRALAALALLEVDPAALAAATRKDATALVAQLARLFDAPPAESYAPKRRSHTQGASSSTTDDSQTTIAECVPASATSRTDENLSDDVAADVVAEERTDAWTEYGGLLFLLHLAADLEPRPARTLRWTQHRLALVLLPGLDEADPAALAFAGLSPDAPPPADDAVQTNADELDHLASIADELARTLALRLDRPRRPSLIATVCTRRARVVADPGWIELHLLHEELDIDVRRAGLDLDPGWLPPLGVVVRFVYA